MLLLAAPVRLLSTSFSDYESADIDFVEKEPWKEQAQALPPYPDGSHLRAVEMHIPGSTLEVLIDEPTLSVGEDGVVRYVMVLRSASGSENVFFEGIRCSARAWRTYAFGSSDGTWQAVADEVWTPIADLGVQRYRERLYRHYFCRPAMGVVPRAEIMRRLRYGD